MNGVFIIPTGIGCRIGGNAGDATPYAKLIASVCDKLIVHPNVVNASDFNEMSSNMLYVEGSILNKFLDGECGLEEVKSNKILLVVNEKTPDMENLVGAAKAVAGIDVTLQKLDIPLFMKGYINTNGEADGDITGEDKLISQIRNLKEYYDCIAINTPIDVDKEVAFNYAKNGGVNPWGGVEAKLSKIVAHALSRQVAHAPSNHVLDDFSEVVTPSMAAEFISCTYCFCVLKGLHKAPNVGFRYSLEKRSLNSIAYNDIDFMISPMCYGVPHEICNSRNIPIVYVEENTTIYSKLITWYMAENDIVVNNYKEAVGVIVSMKEGIYLGENLFKKSKKISDLEMKLYDDTAIIEHA